MQSLACFCSGFQNQNFPFFTYRKFLVGTQTFNERIFIRIDYNRVSYSEIAFKTSLLYFW